LSEDELSVKKHNAVLERRLIRKALERAGGNKTRAAQLLELSSRALLYKIRDYGLEGMHRRPLHGRRARPPLLSTLTRPVGASRHGGAPCGTLSSPHDRMAPGSRTLPHRIAVRAVRGRRAPRTGGARARHGP